MRLDYEIEYKRGCENKVADALSRQGGPDEEVTNFHAGLLAVSELRPRWMEEVLSSYIEDAWIEGLKKQLQETVTGGSDNHETEGCEDTGTGEQGQTTIEELRSTSNSDNHQPTPRRNLPLSQHMGIIRWKGKICVGDKGGWREAIIKELHDSSIGGHSGIIATYHRIKKLFYWPNLKEDVHQFIRACHNCQLNKSEHIATPGLLQPLPVPEEAWSSIGMDFITGLPKSRGKEVIMVVVDRLTKYSHFIALSHPYRATDVA